MTATTGNFWTSTSVTPTVARRPISEGPMWVPLASTHSPRLMSWPIGLWRYSRDEWDESQVQRNGNLTTTAAQINSLVETFSTFLVFAFLEATSTVVANIIQHMITLKWPTYQLLVIIKEQTAAGITKNQLYFHFWKHYLSSVLYWLQCEKPKA